MKAANPAKRRKLVYLVVSRSYSDSEVQAVYAKKADALKFANIDSGNGFSTHATWVETFLIDEAAVQRKKREESRFKREIKEASAAA